MSSVDSDEESDCSSTSSRNSEISTRRCLKKFKVVIYLNGVLCSFQYYRESLAFVTGVAFECRLLPESGRCLCLISLTHSDLKS